MNEMADANRVVFELTLQNWRRPRGLPSTTRLHNINDDLPSFGMELSEAREAAQNLPFLQDLSEP